MNAAENRAKNMIHELSTEEIINQFELTEALEMTIETATVRGWLMDELEARNEEAFEAWIDSNEDSPRKFYEAA